MNYQKAKLNPDFKAKRQAYWAKYYAANRDDLNRKKTYRKRYGLTHAEYEALVIEQGGVCASCGVTPPAFPDRKRLVVDHDHVTGDVRGLLCPGCNIGIGHLGDSPARLQKAAWYLLRHQRVAEVG
jgi:hypothetical protein